MSLFSSLFSVHKTYLQLRVFLLSFQELSPTTDTNLVRSLMNLMDCMMDEFADEAKVKAMADQDIFSWLEVGSLTCRIRNSKSGFRGIDFTSN